MGDTHSQGPHGMVGLCSLKSGLLVSLDKDKSRARSLIPVCLMSGWMKTYSVGDLFSDADIFMSGKS